MGGWEPIPQLESVGGRVSFPSSGLEVVCPEAQEQTGPRCSRHAEATVSSRRTGASLPARLGGVTSGFPSGRVCARPSCQGEPPAEAAGERRAEPTLERVPPQFPSQPLSLWVRKGRRQGSCQGSTSKQCLLAGTYLGELFAVTSNVLPPRKTMSSHRSVFFFFI